MGTLGSENADGNIEASNAISEHSDRIKKDTGTSTQCLGSD